MLQNFTHSLSSEFTQVNLKALSRQFNRICVFDSNPKANDPRFSETSKLIAIGCTAELIVEKEGTALTQLQQFIDAKKEWLFGYLSYDLKNELEAVSSKNDDQLGFPALHFFCPLVVIEIKEKNATVYFNDLHIKKEDAEAIFQVASSASDDENNVAHTSIFIEPKITKSQYLQSVQKLQQHIRLGDIYEINFCQEFFSMNANIDPVVIYQRLNNISAAPFAAYCNFGTHQVICSSPERFLKKNGTQLISQPIKGTAPRSVDREKDARLKNALQQNEKERSENVMIVDLVRNDLSRIAKRGTVNTDELFGAYTFKQVHQLISTVSCELKNDLSFTDIIRTTFPMGSMTGAPKIRAIELIEQYESTKRGLYSGALGFITPEGDFDFNVVIRSILYNAASKTVSFMVGSAITDKAIPEMEYEECQLKAKAMFEVL